MASTSRSSSSASREGSRVQDDGIEIFIGDSDSEYESADSRVR